MDLKLAIVGSIFVAAALSVSCAKNAPETPPPVEAVKAPAAKAPESNSTKVAKIVFVDQVDACDCTKKRIDDTWKALQEALGSSPSVPVERVHLDTEAAKADKYDALESLIVPPGVYLLDETDALVKLLQGEVTREQIAAVLR